MLYTPTTESPTAGTQRASPLVSPARDRAVASSAITTVDEALDGASNSTRGLAARTTCMHAPGRACTAAARCTAVTAMLMPSSSQ